jgi:hypothetical protein
VIRQTIVYLRDHTIFESWGPPHLPAATGDPPHVPALTGDPPATATGDRPAESDP